MAQFGPSSVRSPNGAWEIQFPNLSWDESSSTHVLLKNGANRRTIGMFNVHAGLVQSELLNGLALSNGGAPVT